MLLKRSYLISLWKIKILWTQFVLFHPLKSYFTFLFWWKCCLYVFIFHQRLSILAYLVSWRKRFVHLFKSEKWLLFSRRSFSCSLFFWFHVKFTYFNGAFCTTFIIIEVILNRYVVVWNVFLLCLLWPIKWRLEVVGRMLFWQHGTYVSPAAWISLWRLLWWGSFCCVRYAFDLRTRIVMRMMPFLWLFRRPSCSRFISS